MNMHHRRRVGAGIAAIAAVGGSLLFAHAGTGLATASAQPGAAPSAGSAVPTAEPVPPQDATITLNDGTVIGVNDTVKFSFTGAKVQGPGTDAAPALRCAAVNDPPVYTVTSAMHFLPDKDKPQSSWLLPRQAVSWEVSGSHTFTWEIGGSLETDAGAIIAKAKVKVEGSISKSYTWNDKQLVSDSNNTTTAYRAVLGQVGWKLTAVKRWVDAPCTGKSKTIVILAPHKGDMSIGRQSS